MTPDPEPEGFEARFAHWLSVVDAQRKEWADALQQTLQGALDSAANAASHMESGEAPEDEALPES